MRGAIGTTMGGLCGWIGSTGTAAEDCGRLIRHMGAGLVRLDDSESISAHGEGWAIAQAGVRRPPVIHRSPEGLAASVGSVQARGSALRSQIDALGVGPALLNAYREAGPQVLEQLAGHFALALYLGAERRLLLATDRSGVWPLYCTRARSGWVFASDLDTLRRHPAVDPPVDPQAVYHYLYFHVVPSPQTIYAGVERLDPASYIELAPESRRAGSYWKIEYRNESGGPARESDYAQFRELLRAAVARELADAQRTGCFLSGGTDSSTVTGLVSELSGAPARTYSIGFAAEGFDEVEFARIAARHFGCDHHEYYVTPEDVVETVPRIADAYGEPFGNSSAVPAYHCARIAHEDGVDRLLGGDGGDELFGGNVRYAKQLLFSHYERLPAGLRSRVLEPALDAVPLADRLAPVRKLRRYVEQARLPMPDRLESYNYLYVFGSDNVLEPEFAARVNLTGPLEMLRQDYGRARAETLVNRMLALDLKLTLADNDLPKVSRMSELAGVEVAYPFLDHEVVEFSMGVPADQKVRGKRLRVFFKDALQEFLPPAIIQKKKQGFGLPFGAWLASHPRLHELARDSLAGFKERGIVRAAFVDSLIGEKLAEHAGYYGGFVWVLMILEQWIRQRESSRDGRFTQ